MKALILNDKVIQVEKKSFPVATSLKWVDAPIECKPGWLLQNGELIPKPETEKTKEEKINGYRNEMQLHIDKNAKEKNYANSYSFASYANSTNATWKQEATDFISWRDRCWEYAIDVQNKVESGEIEAPSLSYFIKNAPSFNQGE